MWIPKGRASQIEGTASAEALSWECIWSVQGKAGGQDGWIRPRKLSRGDEVSE